MLQKLIQGGKRFVLGQRGELGADMAMLVGALILMLLALAFSGTIIDFATTSGGNAKIGSFSGAKSMNDLFPLLYYVIVIVLTLAAVGLLGKRILSRD
ncbi:MAG: hypothetical protein ACREQA_20775 [Candidatus Binatia bacterium]